MNIDALPVPTLKDDGMSSSASYVAQTTATMSTVSSKRTSSPETTIMDDSSSRSKGEADPNLQCITEPNPIMKCMSERHYSCLRFSVISLLLTLAASMGGHTIFTVRTIPVSPYCSTIWFLNNPLHVLIIFRLCFLPA